MIVVYVSDPQLRTAACLAAHREEDVVLDRDLAFDAMSWGYPRLLLRTVYDQLPLVPMVRASDMRTLTLTEDMLAGWEAERRKGGVSSGRVEFLAGRLGQLMEKQPSEATWVDRVLSDLGRAAGAPLPAPLRTLGRRILEFPSHYKDLYPLADACALSRGALKARFRRRNLPSPYTYLRWFRLIASGHVLADPSVTVARAARRIGFTSDGNLCRSMRMVTGMTPTEVRAQHGWNRLLITFAWQDLGAAALKEWRSMGDLFPRRAAA